ncbi:hypothetical protein F2Q69_00005908 [Brassica cretica]|uniref:Uncharacterized protein n=1 Tax=Brassica cretica TaxID=69181 RepID=A0A8S9NQ99_BRACR|nr:hypothetical protein F2Q69_00005908 [Brassica cretica]
MVYVERGRRVDSIDGPCFAEIKESLDSLHYVLDEQNQFGIYQIDDDVLSDLEQQKIGESRSRPILRDNPDPGSEPSREKVRSNTGKSEEATINLDEKEEESEEDEEIDRQEGNNVDRTTTTYAQMIPWKKCLDLLERKCSAITAGLMNMHD